MLFFSMSFRRKGRCSRSTMISLFLHRKRKTAARSTSRIIGTFRKIDQSRIIWLFSPKFQNRRVAAEPPGHRWRGRAGPIFRCAGHRRADGFRRGAGLAAGRAALCCSGGYRRLLRFPPRRPRDTDFGRRRNSGDSGRASTAPRFDGRARLLSSTISTSSTNACTHRPAPARRRFRRGDARAARVVLDGRARIEDRHADRPTGPSTG